MHPYFKGRIRRNVVDEVFFDRIATSVLHVIARWMGA